MHQSRATYYNEHDPYAAAWLRSLWPEAAVDERGIVDVRADDLMGYRRCHFFAGLGTWEYALGLAGWPDDRPIWSGSCPCQPFSVAGKRRGEDDPRHLWPAWFRLIRECRPDTIIGEQTSGPGGLQWLDRVFNDLEDCGYICGAADLPAASVGAPHIRQRLFWVGHTKGYDKWGETMPRAYRQGESPRRSSEPRGLGIAHSAGRQPGQLAAEAVGYGHTAESAGGDGGMADARRGQFRVCGPRTDAHTARLTEGEGDQRQRIRPDAWASGEPVRWDAYDIIPCLDGKARRVESGLQCLVDGAPFRLADGRTRQGVSRQALLRAIGNAIVPHVAAMFIRAFLDLREGD